MADDDFDAFYASTFDRLVGQVFVVTGDLHEAEDAVQEAMARAAARWRRVGAYDIPAVWVRRVALNLAANSMRNQRRRLAILIRLKPPPAQPPVSDEALALAEALRSLRRSHRAAIVLHHLEGLSVDEVAAELSVPAGTVKTWLARGRKALAGCLAEPDNDEIGVTHG
jgi:RNA polymerase sigma-70 factor (ECF subfamily)